MKTILLLLLVLMVASCSSPEHKRWRIGVSQCSSDDWRVEMNEEIRRELMLRDDAEVEIRSAESDNNRQIEDIRYFIDNDFDIIIAAPNESGPLTPIIKEAYGKGIPVLTFDRNIDGDYYTAHIEADNRALGASAARYAKNLLSPGAKVIEIKGTAGMSPTERRHQGFTEEMALRPDVEIVASHNGNWDGPQAAHLVDSLTDVYPDVDLIFFHSDGMAIDASELLMKKGLDDVKIIGIDGIPHIGVRAVADGVVDATFLYPTMGDLMINTALDILEGKKYDKDVMVAPQSAVDKTNADILLGQKALQKGEVEKIGLLQGKVNSLTSLHSAQTIILYAAVVIVVLLFVALFMFLRMLNQNRRHRDELEAQNKQLAEQRDQQKELYRHLDEATRSKLVFFTNVSHDLRTPLTLIDEPIGQVIENKKLSEERRNELLNMAYKNIKILRRLVNQILDFRKYDNGKLSVNLAEVRFGDLLSDWFGSFRTVAERRRIKLTKEVDLPEGFTTAVDVEKMERVVFNLMSNAMKYTPDCGTIHLGCRKEGDRIVFSVSDTGMGISSEDKTRIFERFYQVGKEHSGGSGIGLALTKSFVELHGGEITVESIPGTGSRFTVSLPEKHVEAKWEGPAIVIAEKEIETELATDSAMLEMRKADDGKPTVLIIDDSQDIRKLVCTLLEEDYNILTAADGHKGVALAVKYVPDLIICDVMMPVMDGFECCRVIKKEISTSHIPVLMLTACSLDEQRVYGYDSGADGYLPKPFNSDVLKSRCRNLIENRKRINMGSAKVSITDKHMGRKELAGDIDSDFYSDFLKVVDSEMGNPDLSIDSLARKVGLGQSQFSRKIKALTNNTPVELLRILRLKRARKLLMSTDKTIGEIAFEVGFTSQAYFSKCFKDTYRETPSELRDRLRN